MRETTIFYRSFYEALKDLPAQNKAEIYDAIFELSLNGVDTELTGLSKTIMTLIKPQILANLRRFENGKKQKRSKSEAKPKQEISKTEAKVKQNESKSEANNNNNNNNNINNNVEDKNSLLGDKSPQKKSFEERKKEFANKLIPHIEKYGKEMIRAFFDYWSEPSQNKHKMRFEGEKYFDISRRLTTWNSKEPKLNNNQQQANRIKIEL